MTNRLVQPELAIADDNEHVTFAIPTHNISLYTVYQLEIVQEGKSVPAPNFVLLEPCFPPPAA